MTRPYTVLHVFGTRPEAIKMAPLVHAINAHPDLRAVVAVTGQHRGMLDQVLDLFDIRPDIDLDLHTPGQTLTEVTTRALIGLATVIDAQHPDAIVVQGDTTTTLAGALAGFYARVPVVHLEAGLRSGDPDTPFPEERNRRMTTQLADLHLAATPSNRDTLLAEGIPAENVVLTGNTVIDALLQTSQLRRDWEDPILAGQLPSPRNARSQGDRPLVLVTAHRRESWGEPLARIARAVATFALSHPQVQVVWPLHANPDVQRTVRTQVDTVTNVLVTNPVGYADFVQLMATATIALTDSGGVQEEAPALSVPVLVTREVTERREAVEAGAARLVGTDPAAILTWLTRLLTDPVARAAMTPGASPYGDGAAAPRAATAIAAHLRHRAAPSDEASLAS